MMKIFPRGQTPFDTRGFSIVEIAIALGILSVIMLGTVRFFSGRFQEQNNLMLRSAKFRVIKQMENSLVDPNNIKASLEILNGSNSQHNVNFLTCLMNPGDCPVYYFDKNNLHQLDYFTSDGAGGYIPLTSFWSKEGASGCLPPDPSICPMQTKLSFWFTCASQRVGLGLGSVCSELSHVNLLFQIQPTALSPDSEYSVNFNHPTPTGVIGKPEDFAISIPIKDIMALYAQSCMTYHYMDGYSNDGRIICRCLNNRTKRDSNGNAMLDSVGRPLCESNQCKPTEIFLGFEIDANNEWRPICLGEDQKKHCYSINLKTTPECAENYWITHIDYGKCSLNQGATKKKVYTIQDITCEDDSAKCCRQFE